MSYQNSFCITGTLTTCRIHVEIIAMCQKPADTQANNSDNFKIAQKKMFMHKQNGLNMNNKTHTRKLRHFWSESDVS